MDYIRQLEEQMDIFGVSVHRFALTEKEIYVSDNRLEQEFLGNVDPDSSLKNIREFCEENTVYVGKDHFGLQFYAFLLPKETEDEQKPGEMMFIGPFLSGETTERLAEVTKKFSLTIDQEEELKHYYNGTPYISDLGTFEGIIMLQTGYILGKPKDLEILRIADYYGKTILSGKIFQKEEPQLSMKVLEERYALEENLLASIAVGDVERAYAANNRLSVYHLGGSDGSYSLRAAKNMMLSANTLYRKAVQSAAVHPFHIDKISRAYAKRIEDCVFVKDLEELSREMIRKYCLLVRNYSMIGYSTVVRNAINYIICNLKEPLSLKILAEEENVSSSYLSGRFKKEVGRSVVDYINERRVFSSIFYLATTDMPIAEVAQQVGIQDEGYFSRLFKKYQNRTPKQYRNLVQAKK